MIALETLTALERRYEELTELLAQSEVAADPAASEKYAREHANLEEVVQKYREYQATERALADTEELLRRETDEDLAALAREEIEVLRARREKLWEQIRRHLLPSDPHEEKACIVEIRAGTGGEEAALFAADLYRMYTRYAERQGWQVELVDYNATGLRGFKEIIFQVKGKGAYSRLRHERGVHRVQRIPLTEAGGRIHTSTATVAVLPEVAEVEVRIDPDDLETDTFRASGPGGQNVQKNATAVRITHKPTGLVAISQDERSQLRNKQKALAVLRARLYDMEQRKVAAQIDQARRAQVGTGERSEKVRTYNFPQDRVTDHRLALSWHNLPRILDGEIDELVDALAMADQAEKLTSAGLA